MKNPNKGKYKKTGDHSYEKAYTVEKSIGNAFDIIIQTLNELQPEARDFIIDILILYFEKRKALLKGEKVE